MATNKTYWKSVDQLDQNNPMVVKLEQNEFPEKLPQDFNKDDSKIEDSSSSRRDFLKYVGFSTAAATVAACEGPVIKSVPYVVQPEQIRPGIANFYATTIADGYDFASVLVKTREGRPIKIESNSDSPLFGCANARVHASVLSIYDSLRLQGPKLNQSDISWENFVMEFKEKLKALEESKKPLVLLTQTFASPTTKELISKFISEHPNITHVVYDTISESHALNAYENIFKKLKEFKPNFILLSAGFDAHKDDPLAQINLESKDYYTLTNRILSHAKELCGDKVVSILEGGYDLNALKESVGYHVKSLME